MDCETFDQLVQHAIRGNDSALLVSELQVFVMSFDRLSQEISAAKQKLVAKKTSIQSE
jgi:hypothetical protein